MDPLRVSFVALIVAALLLGGYTAVDTGRTFEAVDAVEVIEPRISVETTGVELGEESVVVTLRMENPTGRDIEHTGARLRFHNASDERIASGSGTRIDDNGSEVPEGGSLTVTYAVQLSEGQREALDDALGRDAALSMSLAMALGDTSFVVRTESDASEVVD